MNDITISAKELIQQFTDGIYRELDQQRDSVTCLFEHCEEFKVEIAVIKLKLFIIGAVGGAVGAVIVFLIKVFVFGVK